MAFRIPKATLKILNETGFSTKLINRGKRLISKDGSFNIIRTGRNSFDIYYYIFEISWTKFLAAILLLFFVLNVVFALGFYWVGVDQLSGISSDQPAHLVLLECYFFSVQTFTTVGYGTIHPIALGSNMLGSMVSFIGFFAFSIFTGLSLARFAKPQSKISFSKIALVNYESEPPMLEFRIVNSRPTKLFSVEATVVMTCLEKDKTGNLRRHFSSLKLEYDKIIMLPIDWTIRHYIDQNSPLFKMDPEGLEEISAEFLVSIKAYDDAYNQDIHANHSYYFDEIKWDANFHLMYKNEEGSTILDLNKLSDYDDNSKN